MKIPTIVWILFVGFVTASLLKAGEGVTVIRSDEGFTISEEGRKVLFYQIKVKSKDGKFKRANYVHPLYSLGGEVLTEDFPKDHEHHRGVFWAWHTLTVAGKYAGDNWVCDDFEWDLQEATVVDARANVAGVKTRWLWKSSKVVDADGKMKAMVEEVTTLRVGTRRAHYRLVDFEIRLKALLDEVKLAGSLDDKGYGGFSLRMKRPKDLVFTGDAGVVQPQRLAVEGGEWMDMSGSLTSEGKSGITILCHPSLPVFPQKWLLRRGSQQNPQWPGNKPVLLPKGEEVVLRYRLIIHDEKLKLEDIADLQDEYAGEE